MKLLLCVACNQVFNLSKDYAECQGGHGGGQYISNLNAQVWGPKDKIFVLGFSNSTLVAALRDQISAGDKAPEYLAGYGMTPRGREFTAFVIPDAAESVTWVDDRFEPISTPKSGFPY